MTTNEEEPPSEQAKLPAQEEAAAAEPTDNHPEEDDNDNDEEEQDDHEANNTEHEPNRATSVAATSPSRSLRSGSSRADVRGTIAIPRPEYGTLELERLNDILEYECEHVLIGGRENRLKHYNCLSFFWRQHPCQSIKHGRRFTMLMMAEMLCMVCGRPPSGEDEEDETLGEETPFQPLYFLNVSQWEDLEADLDRLRKLMLRKDATVNFDTPDEELTDGAETDLSRVHHEAFQTKYRTTVKLIQVARCLSPIRAKIEESVLAGVYNFNKSVGAKRVQQVIRTVSAIDDRDVQQTILELFEEEEAADGSKSYVFRDGEAVQEIMEQKHLSLKTVQRKFESLIISMYNAVWKQDYGCLMKLRYKIEKGSTIDELLKSPKENHSDIAATRHLAKRVEDLKKKRNDLNTKHGDDPLDKSLIDSDQFKPSSRKRKNSRGGRDSSGKRRSTSKDGEPLSGSKKSPQLHSAGLAHALDQEDEEEEDRARLALNKSKRKPRPIKVVPGEPAPDEGIFAEDGRVIRRLKWSDVEKDAVKEGVRAHGVGHWSLIKKKHGETLRNRTPVQIKDCWRTMIKKGEVHPPVERVKEAAEETEEADETETPREDRRDGDRGEEPEVLETQEV